MQVIGPGRGCGVHEEERDEAAEVAAAQTAIHVSIERARELLCEAKQVIGKEEPPAPTPPNPAS